MSSLRRGSMSDYSVTSITKCSASFTRASGSTGSLGWMSSWTGTSSWIGSWASSRRRRDTHSADSSRNGANSFEQVYRLPSSFTSPTVSFNSRKFACRTSIYDKRGLSTKRLPSRINRFNPENQMSCSELSVPMHEYLGPKDKIQVPDVHCPNVRDKHFTLCKRTRYNISNQYDKTTAIRKTIKSKIDTNPLRVVRGGREFLQQTNCRAPWQTPRLSYIWIR